MKRMVFKNYQLGNRAKTATSLYFLLSLKLFQNTELKEKNKTGKCWSKVKNGIMIMCCGRVKEPNVHNPVSLATFFNGY